MEDNNGLHVFVFCCADYKDIVNECIESIDQFVTDQILSKNIVSNITLDIPGYNLIKDRDFWRLLDPNFEYRNLYNHNWIKQQIFKLNLNKLVTGNILVVDAEVRFKKPIKWCVNSQQHLVFYEQPLDIVESTDRFLRSDGQIYNLVISKKKFVKKMVDIDIDTTKNFITESIIFSTDILKEICDRIEKIHSMPQLAAYQQVLFDNPNILNPSLELFMSEYELYINYLLTYHPEKIFKLIENLEFFYYSKKVMIKSNSPNSQTRWVTFYDQVRDPSWPDCEREEDFYLLPSHIQNECINVFGYQLKIKNGD